MGASPHSFVVPSLDSLKGANQDDDGSKFLPVGSSLTIRRRSSSSSASSSPMSKRRTLSRRVHIKRGVRRSGSRIERKVRTLKSLVPNREESMGLDGLFQDTADYILSLQTRVRVMQMMVNVLAGSN